jgi:acyl carrier protein
VGLAAAESHRGERLESKGMRSLTPDEGHQLLRTLLATDAVQVGALPFDPAAWFAMLPQLAGAPRFSELVGKGDRAGPQEDLAALLASAMPARRVALCEDFVRRQLAAVLATEPDALPLRRPLTEMGLDSLMGLELRNRLEAGSSLILSATLAWSYPTIEALAAHLVERLGEPHGSPPGTSAAEPQPELDGAMAELDAMEDAELDDFLDSELDELEGRWA